jgi:two-component SAPR family response regulator
VEEGNLSIYIINLRQQSCNAKFLKHTKTLRYLVYRLRKADMALRAIKTFVVSRDSFRFAFDEFDQDKSGVIRTVDIPKLLNKLEIKTTRPGIEQIISIIDSKGIGTVTFEDFKIWYINKG